MPFSGDWERRVQLSSRWTSDANFESLATRIVKKQLERAGTTLIGASHFSSSFGTRRRRIFQPYSVRPDNSEWLQEDYFIFHVREIAGSPSADALLSTHGDRIAQVVRGETAKLSEGEKQEILQCGVAIMPNDPRRNQMEAAFIYDSEAGAETAIQLVQYANSQLLEFRRSTTC